MESLVNYESDDESGDCNDFGKCNSQTQQRIEEDANYDEIGMDESSECHDPNFLDLRQSEGHLVQESSAQNRNITTKQLNFGLPGREVTGQNDRSSTFSSTPERYKTVEDLFLKFHAFIKESNNNHAEGHFSAVREKQGGSKTENVKDSKGNELVHETSNFNLDRDSTSKSEGESSQNGYRGQGNWSNAGIPKIKGDSISVKSEELYRRHSSDMEMDDGEDDLDNYKTGDSRCTETSLDFRHKFPQKINFTKGKSCEESHQPPASESNFNDKNATASWDTRSAENEKHLNLEETQMLREEKIKREKGKDSEDRKKDEYFRKDEKDNRKRDEDRWRETDRDRKRESEKYKDDRDRKRSPDRREYKKRSHSPDRRERDRDYERDRDRDRSRDRDRDRDRDREKERERDRDRNRDRDRDRDRDREYRSGDRRSPKYSKRSSGSPERSWKTRKLEKKAAVLNKLGIELKADVTGSLTPRQLLGEQLKAQIQEVEAKTGVTLPTYYNPGVMNPLKYAQQIQKRKLLWGNKNNESKSNESTSQGSSVPSTVKQWEAATFKGDNDGKMTEKFKRLMGIKGDASAGNVTSAGTKPSETKEIIQKQEEMFSNMEAQYQVARMATHTHRGVGLGFGTFQVPPR